LSAETLEDHDSRSAAQPRLIARETQMHFRKVLSSWTTLLNPGMSSLGAGPCVPASVMHMCPAGYWASGEAPQLEAKSFHLGSFGNASVYDAGMVGDFESELEVRRRPRFSREWRDIISANETESWLRSEAHRYLRHLHGGASAGH
jgi:hypothetical protein